MTRREFIILAQSVGLSTWFGDMAFAQMTRSTVTRKSATAAAAANDIDFLRKGVKALMDEKDAMKYASWMYWANSHCTPDPIPPAMQSVWCRCAHTPEEGPLNLNFLPWHRAYLFFFESLIRELTHEAGFALPYWDWYASTDIPSAFTAGGNNVLNWSPRDFSTKTLLKSALRQHTFDRFSDLLEGNPHGTVHVMVSGDMGAIETSARDPVFWAHHGNIDRLWSVWLADPHNANPTDPTWNAQSFAFDVAGQKHVTVASLLKTEDLGYKYDNLQPAATTDAVPARPANVKATPALPNANMMMNVQPQLLSRSNSVDLSGSVNFNMKVPEMMRNRFSMMAEGAGNAPKLAVVLEGVQVTDEGKKRGFEYRIYLNLPTAPSAEDKHDDFFVGIISSFKLSHHTNPNAVLVFPIDQLAPALAKRGLWKPDEVNIALINDDKEAKAPLVTIKNVGLVVAQSPITPEGVKALSR